MNKSSTTFLVVILILAALTIACFLLPDQLTQTLRRETLELFGPILRAGDQPVQYLAHVNSKLETLDQAEARVESLKQQVATLTVENQMLQNKTTENARLREMLGFRAASPYRLRACRVVSRQPSSWWDTVQVNIGWGDDPDLAKDQPVVSPRGVVGKTGEVSRDATDVILMVNQNCSITATVEGSHDQGIVKGQGNFEEGTPSVKMEYLPKNSSIAPGEFIVTSDISPNFPAGLKIGTVREVPPLNNEFPTFGLYREAIIEPTADLNQLDELFIVLGPKQPSPDKAADKPDANSAPLPNPAPDATH